jgi:hypothetical protein
MISFDLKCEAAHVFEIWFRSSADYADQRARRLIACPVCGSDGVEKAVMAPNVAAKGNSGVRGDAPRQEVLPPAPPPAMMTGAAPALPPQMQAVLAMVAAAQAEALPRSTWVGKQFAEKARAIHEAGETGETIIHGQATAEEAQALADDGIGVLPLLVPFVPPEARN